MIGLGRLSLSLSAPVAASGGGATELFPDPTLADVADSTDGWSFSDGEPFFGPLGGTGPGLSADSDFADSTGRLAEDGADNAAFAAATNNGATYAVSLTIANYVSGSISCTVREGTPTAMGALSNGVITQNIVAGSGITNAFVLTLTAEDNDFDITAISVVASGGGEELGPELLTNGDMSSDVGWTLDGGDFPMVIAGGVMTEEDEFGAGGYAVQSPSLTTGLTYRLVFTVNSITGAGASVNALILDALSTDRTAPGTYSQDIVAGASGDFRLAFNGGGSGPCSVEIDNVSLKQVL